MFKEATHAFFNRYRLLPPAALHHLVGDVDRLVDAIGLGESWRARVVETAGLRADEEVLELGCGSGALAVIVKRAHPSARYTGLDENEAALDAARGRLAAWGAEARLQRGRGTALDFPDASFDAVFAGFQLCGLPPDQKITLLSELRRVVRPNGRVILADFSSPARAPFRLLALPLGTPFMGPVAQQFRGRIPALLREAGFVGVDEVDRFREIVVTWRAEP